MNAAVLPSEPRQVIATLARILSGYAYRFSSEVHLHDAIDATLTANGWAFEREVSGDASNRFDFWCAGIVIEIKVDGSLSQALRQVDRYAALDGVHGVLLAATPAWARSASTAPCELQGTPIAIAHLSRQSL